MGNREANDSMVKFSIYNNLPKKLDTGRRDNLAHPQGSMPLRGPQLV